MRFRRMRPLQAAIAATLAAGGFSGSAGASERAVLIVDPTRPESMYVANYYQHARGIPAANILYIKPPATFANFADVQAKALLGALDNRRLDDHADFVVVTSPASFFVSAPGIVSDGCSPVNRFSISAAYTHANNTAEILAGIGSNYSNRYYSTTTTPTAFDSSVSWSGGSPGSGTNARRYHVGACLGYTGSLGNSLSEILTLIDRSVLADGTRPPGTFYYEQTTDSARSGPRQASFDAAVNAIIALGGQAEHQMAILPIGRHDCLGIMTGWADPGILAANMTILPGAFCDHLTSYAATFDVASQEKVSAWIAKGASGSWGTVEEPCNYPGKFPHARLHVYYYQGLTLGEACFRSVAFAPIQGLLYGDPLTRPFAYIPTVSVSGVPTSPVGGVVPLAISASTANPAAAIATYDILVDGTLLDSVPAGAAYSLYTTRLSDGWHDLRVLAYDDTPVKSVGRWIGSIVVSNLGQSASISAPVNSGDLDTDFQFDVSALGDGIREVRLVHNGRVLGAAPATSATFHVFGQTLGAGVAHVQAEALVTGGRLVRSAPVELQISYNGGSPDGQPPVSSSYTARVQRGTDALIELPATFRGDPATLTYVIVSGPTQATIPAGQSGPTRVITPTAAAYGADSLQFRVDSPSGSSAVATVQIQYTPCTGDIDQSGQVDVADLALLLSEFGSGQAYPYVDGDLDGDRFVMLNDLALLLSAFGDSCP
ncbi:MAG: hypothetical protein HZB38_19535 [Planctomycetes bacterium]|nr:hypothetical protein [Planctomycetota bacterium]